METLFIYWEKNIVSCEKQDDWMYKLITDAWNTYIVFEEEIQDNLYKLWNSLI